MEKNKTIVDTTQNICKHEILMLVRALKKMGVFEAYLEERYGNFHYFFNGYGSLNNREFVPIYDRFRTFLSDMSNYVAQKLKDWDVEPGSLIRNFDDSTVSFDWDESSNGWEYWENLYDKMSEDPKLWKLDEMVYKTPRRSKKKKKM